MLTKRSRLGESKLCPAEKVPLHTKQVADRGASSRTLRGAVRGLLLPRAEEQGTCLPSKRWVFPDTLRCLCMLMRSPVLEKNPTPRCLRRDFRYPLGISPPSCSTKQ